MKSHFLLNAKSMLCKMLVLLSGILIYNVGNAQQVTPSVKAGIGFSDWNLKGSDVVTGILPSFHLGVFASMDVHPSIGIVSGLEFSNGGAELKFTDSYSPKYSLSYIGLPVYGKLQLAEGLSMYAGPKAGLLLSANEKEDGGDKHDVKDAFKNADFSIECGLQYKLPAGIEVGAYFTQSLTNIYNAGETQVRNYGFGLNAAYIIPMPKA